MSTQKRKHSEKSQMKPYFPPGMHKESIKEMKAKEIAEGASRVDKNGNPVMVPHEPVDL